MGGEYNSVIAYFAPHIDHYLGKKGSENCKFICETCEAGLKTVIKSHYCTASFSGQRHVRTPLWVSFNFGCYSRTIILDATELHSINPKVYILNAIISNPQTTHEDNYHHMVERNNDTGGGAGREALT